MANLGPITHHADTVWVPSHVTLCHAGQKHKQNNNSARTSHFLVQYNFSPSLHSYDPKFPYFFSWTWHPVYPRSHCVPAPYIPGMALHPGIAVSRGLTLSSNVLSMRLNLLLLVMLLKKRIVLSISHLLHPRCNVRITCPVRGGKEEDCFGTSRVGRSSNDACAWTLKIEKTPNNIQSTTTSPYLARHFLIDQH